MNDLDKHYSAFFQKSEAGKYFIDNLIDLIAGFHTKAEDNPEKSRDYVQRAKGAREVLDHIKSVSVERKS